MATTKNKDMISQLTIAELEIALAEKLFPESVGIPLTEDQKSIGAEIFRDAAVSRLVHLVDRFGTPSDLSHANWALVEKLVRSPVSYALQVVSVQMMKENPSLTRDEACTLALRKVREQRSVLVNKMKTLIDAADRLELAATTVIDACEKKRAAKEIE